MKRYPLGSVSCATMRHEDLIPTFCYELSRIPGVSREHKKLVREIEARIVDEVEFGTETADYDLEDLFNALDAYSGPFFYFGSHPGDGADYGYWLSESWDEEFSTLHDLTCEDFHFKPRGDVNQLKVSDLSEVPSWFVGFVAVINDHGNVSLYRRGRNHRCYLVWDLV